VRYENISKRNVPKISVSLFSWDEKNVWLRFKADFLILQVEIKTPMRKIMESQQHFHSSDKEDLSVNVQIFHCAGTLQDFSGYTLNGWTGWSCGSIPAFVILRFYDSKLLNIKYQNKVFRGHIQWFFRSLKIQHDKIFPNGFFLKTHARYKYSSSAS